MKKEKMFIHAFNIGANCYIYDVNLIRIKFLKFQKKYMKY